jgi:hypothetical protein
MGTKLVREAVTRAGDLIQDTTNVRWTVAELVRWLSDGQREVVGMRPDTFSVTVAAPLLVGSTRQALPLGGEYLIDVVRNLVGSMRAIRLVDREVLDAQLPSWHSVAQELEAKHFVYDPRTPTQYFLYPPPTEGSAVEITYSVTPQDLVSEFQSIAIPDTFFNALVDYVCFRAYTKDAEYAGNVARAQAHYQSFTASIGANSSAVSAFAPEKFSRGNPNVTKR